ncbi:PD-(D/E)XK nuclease family protein [Actinobacteria bacterium YIM 96077]|uniref:Recombinase RecB n=1 Tax=Phytoactinopolyspora halophila TaxID=1981511 RepID=A0A329R2E6_9ACTN|nr:PD-(D/E)XK nuclease family protein [Phytoactinopolyspora halophila]AYY11942.1 PD-(D/E)XK nuclease family protein [Actinobacteria bacterium YIM 96077]RAW18824.1 recombinase RecB [Phytoactinopolyspora halophila]
MNDQPTLRDMPKRLYRATPTRLLAWLDCPRRYRFTYLDRPPPPKGPPWAHNTVGAAVHNALAQWWRLPREARTVIRSRALVTEYWSADGFRDADQAAQWHEHAQDMVERYVSGLDPDDEPRGVERTVSTIHEGVALSGRIDRVDERGAELVVVDYKTGRHVLGIDDARSSLALAVYAAAVSRTLRRPAHRVELHHLPSGEVVAWEHDDHTIARHLDRAAEIAAECEEADDAFRAGATGDEWFPPRPSPLCGWCDYRQHCPEGAAASPARAPWSALTPPATNHTPTSE